MNKSDRKKLLKEFKKCKRDEFEESLPMECKLFEQLFNLLDEKLDVQGCNHTLDITLGFLDDNNISRSSVIKWLNEQGGYCDCEVLDSVEEKFRGDAIL